VQWVLPVDFDKQKRVFFQPPGYVFGVVWTVLYLMLGLYSHRNLKNSVLLGIWAINLTLNMLWTPIVNNLRMYQTGIYILVLMIMTVLMMIILDNNTTNKALMIPYLTWLMFALLLNIELARLYKGNQVKFSD
jgi:tryptophan-rich sensory protein